MSFWNLLLGARCSEHCPPPFQAIRIHIYEKLNMYVRDTILYSHFTVVIGLPYRLL